MKRTLVVLALVVAAFAWGVASAQYAWFPYPMLKSAWSALRSIGGSDGERVPGVWNPAPVREEETPDALAELANLPYLRGTQSAPEHQSVVHHDPAAAWNGLNLVVSAHAPEATLVDMRGSVVHRWSKPIEQVFPEPLGFDEWEPHKTFWRRAHLLPGGELLAIFEGIGMVKLDADSEIVWAHKGRCHHDLHVDREGRIWTLARHRRQQHPRLKLQASILEDFVLVLSPEGEELRRISILDAFLRSPYQSLLANAARKGDLLHTNTVELLEGDYPERTPMWQQGRVLLSVPTINTVAVLDPEEETITWALAGLWSFQHQPTVLEDGNLLVFDNLGEFGHSKAVEVDPVTQEVVWSYDGSEDRPLDSRVLGSVQRLPNGNTLIIESNAGRAVEVDRDGHVAWEFLNPARAGEHDELIASLLEVVRLDPATLRDHFPAVALAMELAERPLELEPLEALIERLER